ncbi:MAG: FKBP-type peptidyl-prolyl cis-trans isomerase [Cyclobacteriaceae bacterium]|nr:FKBP-type peptidyl-prolyl cis-trans isomerase [Cyclobacteriaceae bacterium]
MRGVLSLLGLVVVVSVIFTSCLNNEAGVNEFEEQWRKDTTAIGIHIRTNGIQALKDVTGVYFEIVQQGAGFPPKASSQVRFGYKVSVLGNTSVVDQSTETLQSMQELVPGVQVGLSLLTPGSKAILYIPSGYAYGGANLPGIPSNSNLKFEVELKSVTKTAAEASQLGADTVALDQHLTTNAIENVVKDPSGLRYVITQAGAGPNATLYNKVKLNYTGKILSSGTVFFTGNNAPSPTFDSRVINYIYAFQAGLTKMNAGTKATLYVPSVLGFGNQSVTGAGGVNIPANSNLLYEIELVEIVK